MAIVVNKETRIPYKYLGDNKFRNMINGKEKVLDDETITKSFNINLDATILVEEYPLIETLIQKLGLRIEKHGMDSNGK